MYTTMVSPHRSNPLEQATMAGRPSPKDLLPKLTVERPNVAWPRMAYYNYHELPLITKNSNTIGLL